MAVSKPPKGKRDAKKTSRVPTSRVGRLARVASLAGGVAGGMLAEGVRSVRDGRSLKAKDLLLTRANAERLTDQLATMRGAAMKLGQILSMETGQLLPKELSEVLSRLRSDAQSMPVSQLESQLVKAFGDEWPELLYGFNYTPLASASIGQVHRCYSPEGEEIVLKIQYPGIAQSIDSDVDNIATILRLAQLLPKGLDIKDLLEQAKVQLHGEADYCVEAEYMTSYAKLLGNDERFFVPSVLEGLSSQSILAMTFVNGEPIEDLPTIAPDDCDRVMAALIELMFTELFEWQMVQTDPNFANYQYRCSDGKIILLDFGATRRFDAEFTDKYRLLARAAIDQDRQALKSAAEAIGYVVSGADKEYVELTLDVFMMAGEPMLVDEAYDFSNSDLPAATQELAFKMQEFSDCWHAPPTDALYFHRKLGGMFMLANRIGAKVNVHEIITRWV